MAAAAAHNRKVAKAKPKGKLPKFRPLQLATLVDAVPAGNGWFHEIKYDGYRAEIAASGGDVRVYTRSGLDWTGKFAPLVRRIAALARSEEHTSELQSLMRIPYAVFCLQKHKQHTTHKTDSHHST